MTDNKNMIQASFNALHAADDLADRALGRASGQRGAGSRLLTRRAFAARAGAVTAGAVAAFIGGNALLRSLDGDVASSTSVAGNWFALTAYAKGIENDDGSVTARQFVTGPGSMGGGDGGLYSAHSIDFNVTGAGVREITYTLEGDCVGEPVHDDMMGWVTQACVYFGAIYNHSYGEVAEGEPYPESGVTYNSFSIAYADQEEEQKKFNRQIWTYFPTDDEIEAAYEQDGWGSVSVETLIEKRAAELMSQVALVLTVTYEDGTTQTKRYTIAPVENFDEACAAWFGDNTTDWPDLYTLTETEE